MYSTRFQRPVSLTRHALKRMAGRTDNLICAVLVLEGAVVVKTVMHDFTLEA